MRQRCPAIQELGLGVGRVMVRTRILVRIRVTDRVAVKVGVSVHRSRVSVLKTRSDQGPRAWIWARRCSARA